MSSQQIDKNSDTTSEATDLPLAAKLNNYLHTKPEVKIGNPAIIWHRAYWKPNGMDDADWHAAIADVFRDTHTRTTRKYKRLLSNPKRPRVDPKAYSKITEEIDLDKKKFESIRSIKPGRSHSFSAVFEGISVTIVFEVYEEFWSKKMILDFSSFEYSLGQPFTRFRFETSIEFLGRLLGFISFDMNLDYQVRCADADKKIRELPKPLNRHARISAKRMTVLSVKISQCLHEIDREFFPEPAKSNIEKRECSIHAQSLRFADFIGHSFGLPAAPLGETTLENMRTRRAPFSAQKPKGVSARVDRGAIYKNEHLDNVIEAAWRAIAEINPLVSDDKEAPPDDSEPVSNIREFSLTLIDRRRALYVSSLGRAGASGNPSPARLRQPLAYMVLCPHQARWQIGRIIDTLHNMGMFRLAAMHQYEHLAKIQNDLRTLQEEAAAFTHKDSNIDGIEQEFSEYLKDPNPVDAKSPALQLDTEGNPLPVGGGLRYRLDWTESYMRSYWRLVESLETEPVEGYQQYREFIERNLSDNFENIKLVRARVEYLDSFIATRYYTFNQNRMAAIQREFTALQQDMRNASVGAQKFTKIVTTLTGVAAVPVLAKLLDLLNLFAVDMLIESEVAPFDIPLSVSGLAQYLVSALIVVSLLYWRLGQEEEGKPAALSESSEEHFQLQRSLSSR